jgi:hypothetical protein
MPEGGAALYSFLGGLVFYGGCRPLLQKIWARPKRLGFRIVGNMVQILWATGVYESWLRRMAGQQGAGLFLKKIFL